MNIYLARQYDTSLYKIGVSKHPEKRIKELQTGNASSLELITTFPTKFGFKLESAVHSTYRMKRVNQEWFELENEDVSLFLDNCEKLEKSFEVMKQYNNPFL